MGHPVDFGDVDRLEQQRASWFTNFILNIGHSKHVTTSLKLLRRCEAQFATCQNEFLQHASRSPTIDRGELFGHIHWRTLGHVQLKTAQDSAHAGIGLQRHSGCVVEDHGGLHCRQGLTKLGRTADNQIHRVRNPIVQAFEPV